MIQIQELIAKWLPSITTTSLFAAIIWFGRQSISEWLTNSLRLKFDREIETFKSSLKLKETQIEALRAGALSSVLNRQNLLYEKQLNAVEVIWQSVIDLRSAKHISSIMNIINFDEAIKDTSTNQETRQAFELMGGNFNFKTINFKDAAFVRPFVTPLTWAFYSAYQSIITHALVKYKVLISGLNLKKIANSTDISNLLKVALPYQKEYIEQNKDLSFHYLLEELESKILDEIKLMLKGDEADKESVEKAAQIIKAAEAINESI
jgi:hypothetical protein